MKQTNRGPGAPWPQYDATLSDRIGAEVLAGIPYRPTRRPVVKFSWERAGYIKPRPSYAKRQAHALVTKLLEAGALTPGPCDICGAKQTVAHHDDYSRPERVRWLCRSHHSRWHLEFGEADGAH